MNAYEEMHYWCANRDSQAPPAKCSNGTILQAHMNYGIVVYVCPCGARFEKTLVEIEVYGLPLGDLRFPCPSEQKS